MNKTVILYSDFEIDKFGYPMTGYSNIMCELGERLSKSHNVVALGASYQRNQHRYSYAISQLLMNHSVSGISAIKRGLDGEAKDVIIGMDIPMISRMVSSFKDRKDYNIWGIFAVEGDPLIFSWAKEVMKLDHKYVISEFGVKQCADQFVKSEHFVVPTDRKIFYPVEAKEKELLKKEKGLSNKLVVFCNSDSNERKNISSLLLGVKDATKTNPNIHLVLLTRKYSPFGWNYDDFINELDLNNNVTVLDRGMAQTEVRNLYAMSDLYVQPSKAEGCNLPVLEAQSVGIPVMATDCTALTEHVNDGKGIPMPYTWTHRDVFGNANRYYVVPETISKLILENIEKDHSDIINKAYEYIDDRNKRFDKIVEEIREKI